jgi:hypothetical protein
MLLPISGSHRNKPGRSLTAAQERCLHAFGGLDSNTVIHHLSDIIALQCYTIVWRRFCQLSEVSMAILTNLRHETEKSLLRKTKNGK